MSKRLQTAIHRRKSFSILSLYSLGNIVQVKTLCNVAQGTLNNNAQKKMLCNVALILLGQHCTGKNLVQCCARDSRQHCTEKNPAHCYRTLFSTNVPLTDKPGSWFLLAKCLKNNCGRVTF